MSETKEDKSEYDNKVSNKKINFGKWFKILGGGLLVVLIVIFWFGGFELGDEVSETPQASVSISEYPSEQEVSVQIVHPGNVDELIVKLNGEEFNLEPQSGERLNLEYDDSDEYIDIIGKVGDKEVVLQTYEL